MAFLDTSMVVRYRFGTPPHLADRAAVVIDHVDDLQVAGVTVLEVPYVLTRVYRIPRQQVVDYLVEFLQKANIDLYALEKGLVIQALLTCRPSGRISLGDALIWAAVRTAGAPVVYSRDERFPADGLEILQGLAEQ